MNGKVQRSGMTLVEVLISVLLLMGAGSALLLGMQHASIHADYLSQFQVAMNAAQGELERLMATSFDSLWTGAEFADARRTDAPMGQCVGIGEDANCNGQLDAGEDLDGDNALDAPLPGGRLTIQIKQADPRNPLNPALLDLHVAACWTAKGRRIGEDQDCDGELDVGEDAKGNGWLDSPVMVSTRIARR